ncbi:acyl carrier protein [Gilvimarinus agarilyticus]|uniref:phosphopantetheine-binding protein n=1 Tax=unclassified Gilvimarinus TaxID=2642066 RepID=UPI001C086B6E|nr:MULTISPECIES: phosphopantetheine-binding protein [unclassified Gilvimarinus]MBU2885714.1 acyl carrier protein [Gilvimarinus agarilyticus]MDO6570574.1 phosphopantetheine-binding protein [Gilvimarinus sp. 2_MG-2023]MDO6748504.1 phosphopantetheine-binding protein [Gilvimarinus sp. 1_MG-2023]
MTDLDHDIKTMIIEELELEDITIEDIDTEAPLFGDGLGLDSIDALEIGLALQKRFNVKIDANSEQNKEHFRSVASLRDFVLAQQA